MASYRVYLLPDGTEMTRTEVENFISSLYSSWRTEEIGRYLGLSYSAVTRIARGLGIPKKEKIASVSVKKYSPSEKKFIKDFVGVLGPLRVADILGRSEEGIKGKAKRMGLSVGDKYTWEDEKKELLDKHFFDMTYPELGRLVGKGGDTVRKFAESKGYSKNPPRRGDVWK